MKERITIRKPYDFHVHLRQESLLRAMARFSAEYFRCALVMPNTKPAILTGADAVRYRDEIMAATKGGFEPLMTIKITNNTTPQMIRSARKCGVIAGKAYPVGVTTNAEDGIADFQKLKEVFSAMQDEGMVLSVHGEDADPAIPFLDKEVAFLRTAEKLIADFPALKIVLEHVSTKEAVFFVSEAPDTVAATVTPHHLLLTIDDVVGKVIRPHNFSRPMARTRLDRDVIQNAVREGDKKFFLGTDSAPHFRNTKECDAGASGVFSAPVALAILAEFFDENGKNEKHLERFTSEFGACFYGLPLTREMITLVKKEWSVPEEYGDVVPFKAGETLQWRVVENEK